MNDLNSEQGWNAIDAVVQRVADREGVEPEELPPLFETVDTDALEAIVDSTSRDLSVEIVYHGYRICIDGDGEVTIAGGEDTSVATA